MSSSRVQTSFTGTPGLPVTASALAIDAASMTKSAAGFARRPKLPPA